MRLPSYSTRFVASLVLVGTVAAQDIADVPGSEGAVEIVFDMPWDGQASIALYKPNGQMLRPLAQALDLARGRHRIRWDGLDLWGNAMPAGTEATARIIINPGVRAYYEFAAASPNAIPWLSRPFGEGEAMRTGGWLADHSPPWTIATIGERIYLGSPLAEHGHGLIYTNLDGEKMWGGGIKGWSGPEYLTTDGQHVYCIVRGKGQIVRLDASAQNLKSLVNLKGQTIEALAVRDGKLYLTVVTGKPAADGKAPPMTLQTRSAETGDLQREIKSVAMTRLAFDAAGVLYSLADNKLCRTELKDDSVVHTALSGSELQSPISLAIDATGQRLAVGDEKRDAVVVFDSQGKVKFVIGDIGPRKRGPWNHQMVDRPNGLAFDKRGKLWVVENFFTPKRITRYSESGNFEKVFFGPPQYGGGGFLDPNLKSFYYRACEYALDWEKGTSDLANLNDVQADPLTPTLDEGSYSYTKVGRPIYYKGRKYAVGDVGWQYNPGFIVALYDGPVWKPCAVMGPATIGGGRGSTKKPTPCVFLRKDHWKDHWEKQDLADASFIWCDRNGDGKYQVEEVEVVKHADVGGKAPFASAYWGNRCGDDLTFWGPNARLAPSRITDQGVPIYDKSKIQPWSYEALAPRYGGLKKGLEAISQVSRDGHLTVAGQPYQVTPELKLRGGDPQAKPAAYIPPVLGGPCGGLSFVGNVMTESPVGEVGVLNGNGGVWHIVQLSDHLLLGNIFTGREGSWSGLRPERGMEVTHRKHDGETFFGDFIRAQNGKYYAVAGKGFHAICRVEGLNEYKVQEIAVKPTSQQIELNKQLYPHLLASQEALRKRGKTRPSIACTPLEKRTKSFRLDGDLVDWGSMDKAPRIGMPADGVFDIAFDAQGMYIAYSGLSVLGNASEDPRLLFKTGFCFDVQLRSDTKQQGGGPVAGDRRIVFGQHKGQWIAMLYDYVAPKAAPGEGFEFVSPIKKTKVARVGQLPADQVKIAFKSGPPPKGKDGKQTWSAEVILTWAALGLAYAEGLVFRADFGILCADSGGIQVDKRSYWSNPDTEMVSDIAVEAEIAPSAWGTVTLRK